MKKPCMANMVPGGKTPVLPPAKLQEVGYKLALYPVMLLSSAIAAMQATLAALRPESKLAAAAGDLVHRSAGRRGFPGLLEPRDEVPGEGIGPLGEVPKFVMAGLDPAIHVFSFLSRSKSWMPGTRPGMTWRGSCR